jgi:hypothetical protein
MRQAAWEHTSLREHYPIPMPRAKKPPQLSTKERALLNRLDRLSEAEIKRLTTREIFAYFKLIDRVDSKTERSHRRAGIVPAFKRRPTPSVDPVTSTVLFSMFIRYQEPPKSAFMSPGGFG